MATRTISKRPGRLTWAVALLALVTIAPVTGAQPAQARVDGPIEDYVFDAQLTEGYVRDVCVTADRPGTNAVFADLTNRFGGTAGTMRACRNRDDPDSGNPDCNFRAYDPVAEASAYSTCWSNHAQGRALDIMMDCSVGCIDRGRSITDLLLATDAAGNTNALARRMGVQGILFNDRCWRSNNPADRTATGYASMRACAEEHYNHVHIDLTNAGADKRTSYWQPAAPAVPTGTLSSMTGAAGQGRVRGTVDLAGHVGVIAVRAVVGGVSHGIVHSASGTGARAYDAPFTISVTANPPICVHAFDGSVWRQIGTCLNTAIGWSNSMTGGPGLSGRLLGVAKIPGWTGTLGVRAVVNGVPQPSVLTTGGGTDYQPFSAPFTLTGSLASRSVCLQGNSYGYWHPMGPCRWTATGTFTAISGTSGSGNASGVVSITNWWDYPVQVRVTVDGVIDPNSYRYSAAGTGNRAYSAPFTASSTAAHNVCVQANSHGYWTQLGCRNRPRA